MNFLDPIYTEKRDCLDCYKCVRGCPVKAIRVQDGCATVISERCVLCGRCVEQCPNGAKRIRDDLPRARELLKLRPRTIVSLAPAFAAEFTEAPPERLIAALRALGFWGVSETALGAEEVSAHVAQELAESPGKVCLSSACPTAISLLQKYYPGQASLVTGFHSPMLAHAKLLRREFGEDIGVVFIGPCIAKKAEADTWPELLNAVLTFDDLRRWLHQARIDWTNVEPGPGDRFVPARAKEGALYPLEGGMVAGVRAGCQVADPSFMYFSGIENIESGLQGIERLRPPKGLFVELLACEGGCIRGPKTARHIGTACKRFQILEQADATFERPRAPSVSIVADLAVPPLMPTAHRESELREVLQSVGKFSMDDELNCGGCGYETCRDFAHAFLDAKAEKPMCVTYMRRMALKKANALIAKMPSAVVIADQSLMVIECNALFARMFAQDAELTEETQCLEGAPLRRLLPFPNLFHSVLKTGEDLVDKEMRYKDIILHGSIFTIEPHRVVGGIFQDVTRPSVQKEQIVRKARDVIQKNLATVQQIAYLLGENAAESETILDSIIESFSPTSGDGAMGAAKDENDSKDPWKRLYRG